MEFINKLVLLGILIGVVTNFLIYRKTIKESKKLTRKTYANIINVETTAHDEYIRNDDGPDTRITVYKHTVKYEYVVSGTTFVGFSVFEKMSTPKVGQKIYIYYDEINPEKSMTAKKRNEFRNKTLLYVGILLSVWFLFFMYDIKK